MLFPRGYAAVPVSAAPKPALTLRLDGPFDPAFAGEMIAARGGLFEREGVRVALEPGGADADPIALVATTADTIGVAGADRFLLARGKGAPIVAFAGSYLESPVVFYVAEKSGMRTPRDFAGKRVGYQPGRATAVIYAALMTRIGLSRSAVEEVTVGRDPAPFETGAVDVWPGSIAAEAYAFAQKGIRTAVLRPADYGIHVPGTVYFTSEATLRTNPAQIRAFVKAVIAGWELAYADSETGAALVAAFDGEALTPDLVRFKLARDREFRHSLATRFGEFSDAQWRMLNDILVQQRLLDAPVPLADAVTFEFLREAYRRPASFAK
jgi:ABC-type nitrate/sulfonate/bicarbonate transport system substrate-binding protein